ncbi:ABC transporter ATP-binding protein [Cuneatibacter sp. NSJ-177]|uniref:ABC transporter ATP-binding protein n=1 Tax=Cuneatibacter sp. NSJ-177 TaxID=2931401 RepID=UPI001FD1F3FC|nr:ABC transporter ATP-binding protein [Cuneatibacter sp. NSJ-177]MCJ7835854.1 ABC transporter ATP-binding protein [Cuneatibacter sp. NSJ-177]
MLRLEHVVVNYGSIQALRDVSFTVEEGEIVTLIGSNGAGKSTTMRAITGLKELSGGKIYYEDQDISGWTTRKKVEHGIILSPEGRQIFPRFSVLENLKMGGYLRTKAQCEETLQVVHELFPILKEREGQAAGTLSGGEQQMLAVGRAMMGKPKLLLLDEPSLGLAPLIVKDIFHLIKQIREMGTTVLLVEQNARSALKISDRAYVLETGKIVLAGTAGELLRSDEVQKAYLGM